MTPISEQMSLDIKLRSDATFANYIGDAGRKLRGVSGVAVLWGETGTGKSHLLQAACHQKNEVGGTAIYLTDIASYNADILHGLEALDLICIDDIQGLLGDNEFEVGLFHLVNSVMDQGATLILGSNQSAGQLEVRLKDLKSRLLGASSVETDTLTDKEKAQLLKEKSARSGFEIGDEVATFIMSRTSRDVRSLVDLLDRLELETLKHQKRVTIPFVKQVLGA